ncbi:hypothetical protein AB1N83_004038 [Pleurotus pulmonarius]
MFLHSCTSIRGAQACELEGRRASGESHKTIHDTCQWRSIWERRTRMRRNRSLSASSCIHGAHRTNCSPSPSTL